MKQIFIFFITCSFLLLSITSCKDKNNDVVTQRVEPGIYYVGKDLNAIVNQSTTKGITEQYEFDANYNDDVIYLHKISDTDSETDNDCITIPIVNNNCPNGETGTCKGIRYRVDVDKLGKSTITPLDENEDPVTDAGTLQLEEGDQCYFSSWPTDEWALQEGQWASQQWKGEEDAFYFFYREKNINKELYRSGKEGVLANLYINDLITNGDLDLTRVCAGFVLSTIIYDKRTYSQEDEENPNTGSYSYNEYFFTDMMGDSPNKWYIKMYLGGSCFPKSYNIKNWTEGNDQFSNGYYSTGDVEKFVSGEIVGQHFLSFKGKKYNSATVGYGGYGYLTANENVLFSPVTGGDEDEMHVYVLIKHWTGSGTPGNDWLLSDVGALQTEITNGSVSTKPTNSELIKIALLIEAEEFNKAWNNGTLSKGSSKNGDDAQNDLILEAGIDPETGNKIDSSSSSLTSATYNTAITRSPSGAPVRSFTLPKDAIIIQEVY